MDELATLLGRKTDYAFSARKVKRIFNSDIRIVWTIEADERKALEVFAKYADQKISFTDCLSFTVMRKLKIATVFTFDRHFHYAGFEVIPDID